MNIYTYVLGLIMSMSIPSTLTAYLFKQFEKKQDKRQKNIDVKEKTLEEQQKLLVKSVRAAISLGEATALALKNGHTNGETEEALDYAKQIKTEQDDFLTDQAIANVFNK